MSKSKPIEHRGIAKRIGEFSGRFHNWQIFSDFVEMAAISISNPVDLNNREAREARYMQIVKQYRPDEVKRFPEMLAQLVDELDGGDGKTIHFGDVLGRVYHELELHNKWAGQYFTPFEICRMMSKITVMEPIPRDIIEKCGFITAQEPACGSGAMVIAMAEELHSQGINYQKHLHVTAIDVDLKCVCMAYLQFSLLHIPAIVVHGNTLTLEEWSHWYTPAHVLGNWSHKLRRRAQSYEPAPEAPKTSTPPATPAANMPSQLTLF